MRRIFVFCIVIVLICVFYAKPKYSNVSIIQSTLNTFEENLLYEKNPIVLYDTIVNIEDLKHTVFKYQYLFNNSSHIIEHITYKNKSKFMIIHNDCNDKTVVSLYSPTCKLSPNPIRSIFYDDHIHPVTQGRVDVILHPYNVLCIPGYWSCVTDKTLPCIYLSDVSHIIMCKLVK